MKVIIKKALRMSLKNFAEKHNLTLEITERQENRGHACYENYYCRFKSCEVKQGSILSSVFGNGESPHEATKNYASRISNTLLVVNADSRARREIVVPILEFKDGDLK